MVPSEMVAPLVKPVTLSSECNLILVKEKFRLVLHMEPPALQFAQEVSVVQF